MVEGQPTKGEKETMPNQPNVEQEVREADARRLRAMVAVDIPALESILADDMTYTHANAWTQKKTEFIGTIKSGATKYESVATEDVKVRVYGTVALMTGRAAVKAKSDGKDIDVQLRYLDVYVKQQDQWRMVAWQSTRIPS